MSSPTMDLDPMRKDAISNKGTTETTVSTSLTTHSIRSMKQHLRKQIRSNLTSLTTSQLVDQSVQVWDKFFRLKEYENAKSIGLFLSMPHGELMTRDACHRILQDQKRLYVPRVGLDFEKCDMDMIQVEPSSKTNPLETKIISDLDSADQGAKDDTMKKNLVSSATKDFYQDWPRNKWGIPEPPMGYDDSLIAQIGDIDILLVPGLGFDQSGARLGQGKGYYDRFITKMRSKDRKQDTEDDTHAVKTDEPNTTARNINEPKSQKKPLLIAVGLDPSWISDLDNNNNYTSKNGERKNIYQYHTIDGQKIDRIPTLDHDYHMDMIILPSIGPIDVSSQLF